MMRINYLKAFLIFAVVLFSIEGKGQQVLDTIIKIEGKVMAVDVTKVTPLYVSFLVPDNPETYTMERKEIQKIIYKNGRVEEFNKPVFELVDDYSWEAVWLTEDKKDVAELYVCVMWLLNCPELPERRIQ